jgi:hypothetical protein
MQTSGHSLSKYGIGVEPRVLGYDQGTTTPSTDTISLASYVRASYQKFDQFPCVDFRIRGFTTPVHGFDVVDKKRDGLCCLSGRSPGSTKGGDMKRILAAALILVALSACRTKGEKITHLGPGSDNATVLLVLGRPDAMRVVGDYQVYSYLHRHRKRRSLSHTDYTVILKDGKVVEFGPGRAQREGLHSIAIVPPAP